VNIERRKFIVAGAAAIASSFYAKAQRVNPSVGILDIVGPIAIKEAREGLAEGGFLEGSNGSIEIRTTEQYDRLPGLAADLLKRAPAAIIALGGPSAAAAKAATTTVPVVFSVGGDPVELGLVDSLNHPGSNVTGATFFTAQLLPKQLELLLMLRPDAKVLGVLINPNNKRHLADAANLRAAANVQHIDVLIVEARTDLEPGLAFSNLANRGVAALIVVGDPYFLQAQRTLAAMAVRDALPLMMFSREDALSGSLMSYGASLTLAHRQAGLHASRILKGEKPADLPVLQPTKFEFIINLKTAKALRLTIPDKLLALADEVIE
jgi:putative tryptophan/tyrosine transport system substrate-binding protein